MLSCFMAEKQDWYGTMTDMPHDAIGRGPSTQVAGPAAVPNKLSRLMLTLFMLGMVVPVWMRVGPLLLMPHRLVLLVLFVPLLIGLFSGKAGRIRGFDILMMVSALWAVLSLAVNGSTLDASIPQQMGIYMLETFGAYLLARVTIRSADDFIFFVRLFFIALLILVPFAVLEAVTHRAVLLELIPKSVRVVNTEPRWGLRRAQTVFGHPILFGVFCSTAFGLFWYVMRSGLTRAGGAAMAFVGTFVSLSTGALVSIVMQVTFIAWEMVTKASAKRWSIFAGLSVAAYVLIDLLSNRTPFHVLITYATFNSGSAYNRILIWRYGMENVRDRPLFGLGADISLWDRPYWMSSSADNYWLLMAMQYGIPAFLFIAMALFLIIRKVSRAHLESPLARACRAGWLTAVGGLIIAGGTVHYWHGVMAFSMFFFGAGVWSIDAAADRAPEDANALKDTDETAGSSTSGLIYTRQPLRHRRPVPTRKPAQAGRLSGRVRGG